MTSSLQLALRFALREVRGGLSGFLIFLTCIALGFVLRVLGGSLFTHHLLSAMRGASDSDGDGQVTLFEAYSYAYERTLGGVGPGALKPFLVRLLPAVALANVWWVLPVLVHAAGSRLVKLAKAW